MFNLRLKGDKNPKSESIEKPVIITDTNLGDETSSEESLKKTIEKREEYKRKKNSDKSKTNWFRKNSNGKGAKKKVKVIKQPAVKKPPENANVLHYLWYILKLMFATVFSLLGTFSWLFKSLVVVSCALVVSVIVVCVFTYTKVKPTLDECREIAYDKLAQMKRSDFSMLSDTEVYDKDGNLIGLINAGHYEYVPINQISMYLQNGYIAQEDRRFKSHSGVDLLATMRAGLALVKNAGKITQGASTITQQVIKNTYLTQEQTFTRKITEILLAPEVEKQYSKADIMEFYCNTNFYGNRCYGVEAASRFYFNKSAADLEVWEAATLVGISNSPGRYDPIKNPENSKNKRNAVLKSMLEMEYISDSLYDIAIAQPLIITEVQQEGTDENYMVSYAIHCAALELMKADFFEFKYTFKDRDEFMEYDEKYKEVYNEKSAEIRGGGYKIYTSLDQNMQSIVQQKLDAGLARFTEVQDNGKYAMQGASVVVDNETGYVVAIVGGRGTEDQFNRAYLSARQPGSTIKPLIDYAPAFDTGEYYPSTIIDDHKWEDGPSNSGSYYGRVTIREALNRSLNTVAWQVLQGIGVDKGLSYLGKMQFQKLTYVDNGVEALSIGGFTNGARVVDMAKGYSTLANYGVFDDKTCITGLIGRDEHDVMNRVKHQTYQVYTEDTAYMITDILKGTMTSPYGTGRGLDLANGQISAGKTGTTNSNKDTWFCGYTRKYTTAVWVGYDTPRAMPGIFGATYAGAIWKTIMDSILVGVEPSDWERPETVIENDYNPATGEMSATATGVSDLFSTSAESLARQTEYERGQQKLAADLDIAVSEYEAWEITTPEDVYLLDAKTMEIKNKVSQLQEEDLRNPLMKRIGDRQSELESVVDGMKDTIALYEAQKEEEEQEKARQESLAAEAERERLAEDIKVKDFENALKKVTDLKYQADNAESLCLDASEKLEYFAGTERYEGYKNQLEAAINNIKNLPTKAQWAVMEAERIKREEEEAIRIEEERQRLIEEQQRQMQEQLDRERSAWNQEEETTAVPNGPGGGNTNEPGSINNGHVGPGYEGW